MSDPLSIAAGVVGIITAAAQISSLLISFAKASKDAPQQARIVATEVNETSGILSHLQSFLLGEEFSDRSRTSLLKVDQVVIIVSGCVLTFSELEKLLDELKVADLAVLDRMKWARKETDIAELIQRLQNHKASLSLMLNILNGHTIAEAKDSVERLYTLVQLSYQEMSSRLLALERRDADQVDMNRSMLEDNAASLLTVSQNSNPIEQPIAETSGPVILDFTDELESSWVYKRNKHLRETKFSNSTSSMVFPRLSIFSDLSMAEVSTLSVLNLPIASEELFNAHQYSGCWSKELSELMRSPAPQLQANNLWPSSPRPRKRQGPWPQFKIYGEIAESWESLLPSGHSPSQRKLLDGIRGDIVVYEVQGSLLTCPKCGQTYKELKVFEIAGNQEDFYRLRFRRCEYRADNHWLLSEDGCLMCPSCSPECAMCEDRAVLRENRAILSKQRAGSDELEINTHKKKAVPQVSECYNCQKKINNSSHARTSQGILCMNCHESLMARRRRKKPQEELEDQDKSGGALAFSHPNSKDQTSWDYALSHLNM